MITAVGCSSPLACTLTGRSTSRRGMVDLLVASAAGLDLIWNGKTLVNVAEEVGNEVLTRMVRR